MDETRHSITIIHSEGHSHGVSTSSATESVGHYYMSGPSRCGRTRYVRQAFLRDALGELRHALRLCTPLSTDDAAWLMTEVTKLITAAQQRPAGE